MATTARRTAFLLACVVLSTTAYAKGDVKIETDDQKLSYSFGFEAGEPYKDIKHMKLDFDLFLRGIRDRLKDQTPAMANEDMKSALSSFQLRVATLQEEQTKVLAEKNKKESDAFLKANKVKKGIVTLPSGLQYEELKAGTGPTPADDDEVTAHYRAIHADGTEFANTYKKEEPAKFSPKITIPGWREALMHMKAGAKWRLFVPPELAYGEKGSPPLLAPNVVTIFEVELLAVKKAEIKENNGKNAGTSKPAANKKPAKNPKTP